MERLTFSIKVDSSREKAWTTMLGGETYREWTHVFSAGSHYEGDWSEGSEILFLGPDEEGKMRGMVSRIMTNRLNEFLSIEHLGLVENGRKDTTSEAARAWAGARENYSFRDLDGGTEIVVEMDTVDEYKRMFEETWPKALLKLKELAER